MDCKPPGSSIHGILQARIQCGLPCSPPGDLPSPGMEPASLMSPALAGRFFTTNTTWETPPHGFDEAYMRDLGEGNGNPLQYSCLENPMDGGAW